MDPMTIDDVPANDDETAGGGGAPVLPPEAGVGGDRARAQDAPTGELAATGSKPAARTIVIGDLDGLTPIDRRAADRDGDRDGGDGGADQSGRRAVPSPSARATLRNNGPMVFADPGLGAVVAIGSATGTTGDVRSPLDRLASDRAGAEADPSPAGPVNGGEPRLVVIGDADEIDPDAPIDPRIRKRRRDVKRAEGRKRLRWILIAIAAIVVLVGTSLVLRTSVFSVKSVVVTGARYIDQSTLDGITAPLRGESLAEVKLDDVRRKLEASPWVRSVDVTRDWPSTIRIDILERRPVAFYGGDDQLWHVVDGDGRVLALLTGRPVDYLELSGSTEPVPPGEAAPAALVPGARVANAIPEQLKAAIAVVRVANGEVSLEMRAAPDEPAAITAKTKGKAAAKPSMILLGTTDDLKAKLVTVLAMQETCPPGSYQTLNVSAANRPTVIPGPSCKIPGSKGP